eukprot:CAMPEP_0172537926 /NCGR_PEP_ID=MMETSP1067-20121228/9428_1 /TAXON_ID=265564 ORGANISM="Thalassiosira punctigera, Strain Tpunct2005C2" /NCGR_SAMPLE_ID=MMETSP1067 /ASSEMBLY_ACC=CAM_ASM_000444 /LENGTH=720 /DNA_ID=CAMNT_0013323329 /DNA_START=166 /DNA_END=2328 /DNA_ORIENTATION=+
MEELQDLIEDTHYVIATLQDGPRPVVPWVFPEEEALAQWKADVLSGKKRASKSSNLEEGNDKKLTPFEFEWTLSQALGLFLFSSYLKSNAVNDYHEINFMEEVIRWKNVGGRFRAEKTSFIIANYLSPLPPEAEAEIVAAAAKAAEEPAPAADAENPPQDSPENGENGHEAEMVPPKTKRASSAHKVGPGKTQINELDLARQPTIFTEDEVEEMRACADPTANFAGVGGTVLESIMSKVDKLRKSQGYEFLPEVHEDEEEEDEEYQSMINSGLLDRPKGRPSPEQKLERMKSLRSLSLISNELPENLLDAAEVIVAEKVREKHWTGFRSSEYHAKLLNFLWLQDQQVVEEDFFLMRVLGRGGFGLVTACKKGTSGKLYAMKVQNKKRIKIKKSEQLALNERQCLSDIDSPFVVNLKYAFQSQTDVFLILDLMTGGDLSYHLCMRGRFPKKECLYYGARIMLGLQALHDRGYVYRDLKPENCLLGDDGRVRLTDLGVATKVTPSLRGATGTRGYWAPEMLRRDDNGKRNNYNHMVDWFSFGCCMAEFISGKNPFRSEAALNFGLEKGSKTKEKAIDCATLEMNPELDSKKFNDDSSDLCRRLLDKNAATRLGIGGAKEIMFHPWFREVNWEAIISDRMRPPFIPPKDVNAASQSEIGTFVEDKTFHKTVLSETDEAVYANWNFTNPKAFAAEVIEFLIYEREIGKPLVPMESNSSCCCTIT